MKFLFASDSFKGTLSSRQTIDLLTQAARDVFGKVSCTGVPVADGGEGTAEAVVTAERGSWMEAEVSGPLMEKVTARYGKLDEKRAVIEMAAASGLTLVPMEKQNPLNTTSYGTGELIRHALDQGFTDLSIAIGGSATNDGGMGCARALGIRFLDAEGYELEGRGEDLERLSVIDLSGLDSPLRRTRSDPDVRGSERGNPRNPGPAGNRDAELSGYHPETVPYGPGRHSGRRRRRRPGYRPDRFSGRRNEVRYRYGPRSHSL